MKRKKDWYRKQRRERQLGIPFSNELYTNFIRGFLGVDEYKAEAAYYNKLDAALVNHFAAQIKKNNEAFADDSIRISTSAISQSEANITTRK